HGGHVDAPGGEQGSGDEELGAQGPGGVGERAGGDGREHGGHRGILVGGAEVRWRRRDNPAPCNPSMPSSSAPARPACSAPASPGFELDTERGVVRAGSVVIATGGLSIPKIGASDFGYRIARQFGHRIVETRPALVPLTFDAAAWAPFVPLAGLSLQARVETGSGKARGEFVEDLLFTHRGLSGPAILQISTFWKPGTPISLDLAAGQDLAARLLQAKRTSRRHVGNELAEVVPPRLPETWLAV